MSLPLLRQGRISQSLSATRRAASRSRHYSAASSQARTRPEPESHDAAPVAGPSSRQRNGAISETAKSNPTMTATHDASDVSELSSRVQSYLASITASGVEPTLEDLDRYRPHNRPPVHSPKYVETYTELLNTLCRSFTKEQLRKFLVEALGTSRHCATHRKKAEYAESIIEQLWKWPTLKELEKAKRDRTEVIAKTFSVTPSELFMILGRDGTELLRLSKDYDVHISLRRKPLGLRVEGTRGALGELTEYITSLKKTFVEDTYELPSPVAIPPDLVQRISRLASAYLENVPSAPGKLRIVARDEQSLIAAKRLASRAVHEIEESSHTPLLTYLPPGAVHVIGQLTLYTNNYALYPYFSPRSLPFTMNTSGTFRLRRVGEWLSSDFREDVQGTGGLSGDRGQILTVSEEQANLRDVLLRNLPEEGKSEESRVIVQASMGHMLLTRHSGEQRATLVPPLIGGHPFSKVREWIAQNPVKMTFVPDLPLPLLNASPARQSVKHRLVYHALPSKPEGVAVDHSTSSSAPTYWKRVISLEMTLVEPQDTPADNPAPRNMPERDLEEGLSSRDLVQDSDNAPPPLKSPDESSVPTLNASGVHCWTGIEADLNLMIPDRPMDLQFTVRSLTVFPESHQPPELQQYVMQLRAFLQAADGVVAQPSPPLLIEHGGERYILHSNSSVRQSEEYVSDSGLPTPWELKSSKGGLTRALCESTLDLETDQKSMHCEVTCDNVTSNKAWRRFLRDCDRLSVMREQPTTKPSLLDRDVDDV